jgi:DNA repair protein RadC
MPPATSRRVNTPDLTTHGPRERLNDVGIDALADAELVALLLGTGQSGERVEVLAHHLLEDQGGIIGLARAGVGELAARRGIGLAKGARIAAAVELGRRVAAGRARTSAVRLPDCRAVDAWARQRLEGLDHEELWVLAVDGNNRLRAARCVASGGLHGLSVSARDLYRAALREGASAIVMVHNHPSGDPTPSREDVTFTTSVAAAGRVVGVPLLDHVVVADGGFASMLALRLLPQDDGA